MKITWHGTASIILETENSKLLFDPFLKDLPKNYEPKENKENRQNAFRDCKTIFITHGHFDHLSSLKPLYNDLPCKIYLTKTPYRTMVRNKFPQSKLCQIKAGDTLDIDGIIIHALQGRHVKFIKKEVVKGIFTPRPIKSFCRGIRISCCHFMYPEHGETLLYEIQAENKLIQIMGSADLDDNTEYTKGADLLILPHQGRMDIDEHNRKIVMKLQPKRVLLSHYDDAFPPYSQQIPVDSFCQEISKTIPTDKLIEGELVEI